MIDRELNTYVRSIPIYSGTIPGATMISTITTSHILSGDTRKCLVDRRSWRSSKDDCYCHIRLVC